MNLYNLNINNNKVHPIKYKYISIEKVNKYNLNYPLFVINTGGNHIPLNRQYEIQKKIMKKRFPYPSIYEKISKKKNSLIKKFNYFIFKLSLIFNILKIYNLII